MHRTLTLAALLTLSSTPVLATDLYLGIAASKSRVDTDGVNAISAKLDNTDTGSKLMLGYKLAPTISLEAAFTDLGKAILSGNSGDTFQINNDNYEFFLPGSLSITGEALTIGLLIEPPLGNSGFAFLARIGLAMWETEISASFPGVSLSVQRDGTDIYAGLGASYQVNQHWSLRSEIESFNADGNAFLSSLSASYHF